jgi:hypothetical protein
MAKYNSTAQLTKIKWGFTTKTCWIAHILSDYGLTTRLAHNRHDSLRRKHRCPPHRRQQLEEVMRELGILPS